MNDYVAYNAHMWDVWSQEKNTWTIPVSHEQFVLSQQGDLTLFLTPEKPVPAHWYEGLGKKVLGLASGGGQQGPLLTAHGYQVTILDNSWRQLHAERMVAERENYRIGLVKADMTRRFPFQDGAFDWIINPVSNCYIEDLTNTWKECFRVLKPGGTLMTGWTNPIVYMFDDVDSEKDATTPLVCCNPLPYNGRLLALDGKKISLDEGYQFSHTLDAQLGGQVRAGFLIRDFYEDTDSSSRLSHYSALFAANLAIKP